MKEAEVVHTGLLDMVAAGLDHAERSHHIGLIEGARSRNRPVDMALGGEVIDLPDIILPKD